MQMNEARFLLIIFYIMICNGEFIPDEPTTIPQFNVTVKIKSNCSISVTEDMLLQYTTGNYFVRSLPLSNSDQNITRAKCTLNSTVSSEPKIAVKYSDAVYKDASEYRVACPTIPTELPVRLTIEYMMSGGVTHNVTKEQRRDQQHDREKSDLNGNAITWYWRSFLPNRQTVMRCNIRFITTLDNSTVTLAYYNKKGKDVFASETNISRNTTFVAYENGSSVSCTAFRLSKKNMSGSAAAPLIIPIIVFGILEPLMIIFCTTRLFPNMSAEELGDAVDFGRVNPFE